jgi:stress response protein YsnF
VRSIEDDVRREELRVDTTGEPHLEERVVSDERARGTSGR